MSTPDQEVPLLKCHVSVLYVTPDVWKRSLHVSELLCSSFFHLGLRKPCEKLSAEVMRTTEYQIEGLMESLERKTQKVRRKDKETRTQKLNSKQCNMLCT